jgi:hypothetical protein
MGDRILTLRAELSRWITKGAKACPDCGGAPHGIRQEGVLNTRKVIYYEIGCLTDANHRAQGFTRKQAVEDWNSGNYIPAKE